MSDKGFTAILTRLYKQGNPLAAATVAADEARTALAAVGLLKLGSAVGA